MPTIICPRCRTENRPPGLSALKCESCQRTIDPRKLGGSAKTFVRRQRRLRKKSKSSPGPLERDEADELLAWVIDLPPEEVATEENTGLRRSDVRSLVGRMLAAPSRLRTALGRRQRREWLYSDSVVRMGEEEIVINAYYWPLGRKHIPYAEIRSFDARPLKAWHGQFRIQGVDHRGRWYSRDRHRGEKERAIDLTVGRLIHPVLTPDDPDAVLEILERQVTGVPG